MDSAVTVSEQSNRTGTAAYGSVPWWPDLVRWQSIHNLHDTRWSAKRSNHLPQADRDGGLLIGTAGGLCRLIDGRFTGFNAGEALSTSTILSLLEDLEGNVWIGTESGGINLLKDKIHDLHCEKRTLKRSRQIDLRRPSGQYVDRD